MRDEFIFDVVRKEKQMSRFVTKKTCFRQKSKSIRDIKFKNPDDDMYITLHYVK